MRSIKKKTALLKPTYRKPKGAYNNYKKIGDRRSNNCKPPSEQQRQALNQKQNGTRPEEITRAEAEVTEARSKLAQLVNGSRPEEIAAAKANVAEINAQVSYYQVQLEDSRIRAPFGGIITQRYAIQGAFVTPTTSASATDSATSTSVVALARDLEVLAKVPESDIGQIKPGQVVRDRSRCLSRSSVYRES